MHRRLLFALTLARPLARLALLVPAAATMGRSHALAPTHKVSAAELHKALAAKFPLRWGVRGLVDLVVDAPRLLLMPATQQLGATLVLQASGAGIREGEQGEADLAFSLRYDNTDQTVRALRPDILDLRAPGLAPQASRAVRRLLREALKEGFGEVVLYRLKPRELALADTLGFEPKEFTVVDDGLVVRFGRKG